MMGSLGSRFFSGSPPPMPNGPDPEPVKNPMLPQGFQPPWLPLALPPDAEPSSLTASPVTSSMGLPFSSVVVLGLSFEPCGCPGIVKPNIWDIWLTSFSRQEGQMSMLGGSWMSVPTSLSVLPQRMQRRSLRLLFSVVSAMRLTSRQIATGREKNRGLYMIAYYAVARAHG